MDIMWREIIPTLPQQAGYEVKARPARKAGLEEKAFRGVNYLLQPLPLENDTLYVLDDSMQLTAGDIGLLTVSSGSCLLCRSGSTVSVCLERLAAALSAEFGCFWVEISTGLGSAQLYTCLLQSCMAVTQRRLDTVLQLNARFSDISLRCQGIAPMIDYCKEIIGNPVAIYDETFHCIITTDSLLENRASIKSSSQPVYLNNVYFSKQHLLLQPEGNAKQEYSMVSFPISYEGKVRAYLSIVEIERRISDFDCFVLDIAAAFILTEMKHMFAIKSIENNDVTSFLYDIIDQKRSAKTRDDYYRRARQFNLEPDSPCLMAVFKSTAKKANFMVPRTLNSILESSVEDELYALVASKLQRLKNPYLLGNMGSSLVAICAVEDDLEGLLLELRTCFTELKKSLQLCYMTSTLHMGVGSVASGLIGIDKSYKNAVSALAYSQAINKEAGYCFTVYEDNILLKLISSIGQKTILDEIIPQSLKSLQEYDRVHQTQFLVTLNAYFDANCNARLAAESLFIHHRTMLYRINRIGELFLIDLSDSSERMHMFLAVKLLTLLSDAAISSD